MRGKIVIYYADIGTGAIKTDDGEQFIFTRADWVSSGGSPRLGQQVSFEPGERVARNVVMAVAPRIANDRPGS